jgi:hypothetical protein
MSCRHLLYVAMTTHTDGDPGRHRSEMRAALSARDMIDLAAETVSDILRSSSVHALDMAASPRRNIASIPKGSWHMTCSSAALSAKWTAAPRLGTAADSDALDANDAIDSGHVSTIASHIRGVPPHRTSNKSPSS